LPAAAFAFAFSSAAGLLDADEGLAAHVEKREPRFSS